MPLSPLYIQSARILPLPDTISWGQAVVPGAKLTVVNLAAPLDTTSYATRDFELAYRDLILAAYVAEVSMQCADIFGMDAVRPALQGSPLGDIRSDPQDFDSVSTPASVNYVTASSMPLDAVQTDRQLYARDLTLYQALANAAAVFSFPPITPLTTSVTLSDAWSQASGTNQQASVNGAIPYSQDLFRLPDKNLAGRDNDLASTISTLAYQLNDLYSRSTKLLVSVSDSDGTREPEVYALYSDDGLTRIFIAPPGLPDRNRVIYDKVLRTVTWRGETYEDPGSSSFSGNLSLSMDTASLTVIGDRPQYKDAQFWRQKSARLKLSQYKDNPLYFQPNPVLDVSLSNGAIYQPSGIFLPAPGTGISLAPAMPAVTSNYRMSVLFEPSSTSKLYGSLNLSGVPADSSTTATLTGPGSMNWQIKLVPGQYSLKFQFTDRISPTPSFNIAIVWNTQTIFNGVLLFNQKEGTFISSNTSVLTSDGSIGSLTIQRTDNNGGSLTIGLVELINVSSGNIACSMTATMGAATSTALFAGSSGRPDCLYFDFQNALPSTITMAIDSINFGGIYVKAIDVRRFVAQDLTPGTSGYNKWKRTYIDLAYSSVLRAYVQSSSGSIIDYTVDHMWTIASTGSWMSTIAVSEARLFSAFRLARPGDLGQPALTPYGLYYDQDTQEVKQVDSTVSAPVIQALQPWMIEAGIYVIHEDFWITDFDPVTSLKGPSSDSDFIFADFSVS